MSGHPWVSLLTFNGRTFKLPGALCGRNLNSPKSLTLQTFRKNYIFSVLCSLEIWTKNNLKDNTIFYIYAKNNFYKWKLTVIVLSWNAKYNLYYICNEIPKDLPIIFSTLRHGDFVNIITRYTIIFVQTVREFEQRHFTVYVTSHSGACATPTTHTAQHHTFYIRKAWSCFSYLENKHDVFVWPWLASVVNISPPFDSVGPQMNLGSPEKRHWPWYSPHAIEEPNPAPNYVLWQSDTLTC
jgi:hypothetical protein